MQSLKSAFLYGFLLWLIPFITGVVIFPLKKAQSPLFETIMPVTLVICAVIFSIRYFKQMNTGYLSTAIKIGILWFLISLSIDLVMFTWGPMQMSLGNYLMDIGLTYLIYPIVTIGFGYMLER